MRFRDHLAMVEDVYRQMVASEHFDDVDRELTAQRWAEGEGLPPIPESIADKTSEIMAQLHAAVRFKNKQAARDALDRLRDWRHNIGV